MSHEGKLLRGAKWYNQRDRNGNFPIGITNSEKMIDVDYYVNFLKGKNEEKVLNCLKKISVIGRKGGNLNPLYQKYLDELNSIEAE